MQTPTKPLVAVFDVATQTGLCLGFPDERKPYVRTWDLKVGGKTRPQRLLYFSNLLNDLFKITTVDIVRYEAPLPLRVMMQIGASEETMLLLRGAIGVLEAAACRAGIQDIDSFQVQKARKHFTGQSTFRRGKDGRSAAKDAVMRMCGILGINALNDNEGDAICGWHYVCAQWNPRLALAVTPLFAAPPSA